MLDQGLPKTTTSLLQSLGWDVEHANDIGMSRATDSAIMDYASKTQRVSLLSPYSMKKQALYEDRELKKYLKLAIQLLTP